MAPTAAPRQVLRGILRHIKTPASAESNLLRKSSVESSSTTKNASQTFLVEQYRATSQQHATSAEHTEHKHTKKWQQLASDYLALQHDLKERGLLYELDAGAEVQLTPKEMSRRAAARSGLQMPEMDPE